MTTDRIEKQILLRADSQRVWQAISDSKRFGAWFGVAFDGPFVAGAAMQGKTVPTQVDPEVAKLQEPHKGKPFHVVIETIEPMRRFAFRWRPFAIDPNRDYSSEPMTLVSFDLSEADGGTMLTITESGFDGLPADRHERAYKANEGGWTHQTKLIEKYLALPT